MKKIIIFILLLISVKILYAITYCTFVLNLQDAGISSNFQNITVRFDLKNSGTIPPKVPGTFFIVPSYKEFHPDNTGLVTGQLVGNDILQPSTTYYTMTLNQGGTAFYKCDLLVTGTSLNLNSASCLNSTSLPAPPPPCVPTCLPVNYYINGTLVGMENGLNFIQGGNITISAVDDPTHSKIDFTINSPTNVANVCPITNTLAELGASINACYATLFPLGGGVMSIGPGLFTQTTPDLIFTVPINIKGSGTGATILDCALTSPGDCHHIYALSFGGDTPTGSITDLTITGIGAASGVNAIEVNDSLGWSIDNANVYSLNNTGGRGLYMNNVPTALYVAGTLTSGTFQVGETVTQSVSAAHGIVVAEQLGTQLITNTVVGSPDGTHTWVGGTSGAIFTPNASPKSGNYNFSERTHIGRVFFAGSTIDTDFEVNGGGPSFQHMEWTDTHYTHATSGIGINVGASAQVIGNIRASFNVGAGSTFLSVTGNLTGAISIPDGEGGGNCVATTLSSSAITLVGSFSCIPITTSYAAGSVVSITSEGNNFYQIPSTQFGSVADPVSGGQIMYGLGCNSNSVGGLPNNCLFVTGTNGSTSGAGELDWITNFNPSHPNYNRFVIRPGSAAAAPIFEVDSNGTIISNSGVGFNGSTNPRTVSGIPMGPVISWCPGGPTGGDTAACSGSGATEGDICIATTDASGHRLFQCKGGNWTVVN